MKQVSKEDFDILKKYHPGEVRYYIDLNGAAQRRKRPARTSHGKLNRRIQLTTKSYTWMKPDCLEARAYDAICKILDKDPTRIIGRVDLSHQVTRKTKMTKLQAGQTIGELLDKGLMRHVDDNPAK